MDRNVDLLSSSLIGAKLEGGRHDDGAVVVCGALAFACVPNEVASVGNNASSHGCAIVTAEADKHHADLSDPSVHLEVIGGLSGGSDKLAIGLARDARGPVDIFAADLIGRVFDIARRNLKGIFRGQRGAANGVGDAFSVGSHDVWYGGLGEC